MIHPEFDADGYPTQATLDAIENWPYTDARDLLDFVHGAWHWQDWGWYESRRKRIYISTGGWSGNESLIKALQANWQFWTFYWVQSRRGGHYIFELPKK